MRRRAVRGTDNLQEKEENRRSFFKKKKEHGRNATCDASQCLSREAFMNSF